MANPSFPDDLDNLIPPLITKEDNEFLCAIPHEFDIKEVLKQMGSNKTSGPNGIQPSPTILKDGVIVTVRSSFPWGFSAEGVKSY